jgi:hypothetical protein
MLQIVKQKLAEVPGLPGEWVEIRKLGWRALREASEAASRSAFEYVRALGKDGMEAVAQVSKEQIEEYRKSPAAAFDPGRILRGGVVAWSLGDKVTPEVLDDLPEEAADYLVAQIVALSRPPRDPATVKND